MSLSSFPFRSRSFAIGGRIFGFDEHPDETDPQKGLKPPLRSIMEETETDAESDTPGPEGNRYVDFDAKKVKRSLLAEPADSTIRNLAKDFLLVLSVCHSVLPKSSVKVEKVWEPGSPSHSVELCSSVRSSPGRLFSSRASLLRRETIPAGGDEPTDCSRIEAPTSANMTPTRGYEDPWESSIITPKGEAPQTSETRAVKSDSWRNRENYNETPAIPVIPRDDTVNETLTKAVEEGPYHAAEMQLSDKNNVRSAIMSSSSSSSSAEARALSITTSLLQSARKQTVESSVEDEACIEPDSGLNTSSLYSRAAKGSWGSVGSTSRIQQPVISGKSPPPPAGSLTSQHVGIVEKSGEEQSPTTLPLPHYPPRPPAPHRCAQSNIAPLNVPPPPPSAPGRSTYKVHQARVGAPATSPPMIVGAEQQAGQRVRRLHPHPEFLQRDTLWSSDEVTRRIRYEEWHAAEAPSSTGADPNVRMGMVRWKRTPDAQFDASSPDELALVAGAKHMGVEFLRRPDLNSLEVAILDQQTEELFLLPMEVDWIRNRRRELRQTLPTSTSDGDLLACLRYEILEVLDFDNFRKRMSVIIRDRDGDLKLLCKGADSSMLPVLAAGQESQRRECEDCLADFAREGLRTLVLGVRRLDISDFDRFRLKLDVLRGSGSDDVEK